MELRGFELINIDLKVGKEVYDLHNNFDFGGFSYDVGMRELILRWRRGRGEWVPQDSPGEIVVTIRRVSHLSANPRDPEIPYSEDDCLNCVSFVRPEESAQNSFITSSPEPNLHYVFQFMSGFTLRVQGEEALCSITQ